MLQRPKFLFFILLIVLVNACKTPKVAVTAPLDYEEEFLDTLQINGNDPQFWAEGETSQEDKSPYRPSASIKNDLIHTKLNLSFDWSKQHVFGAAEITASPLFYDQQYLELDAINFTINHVKMASTSQFLKYNYDGQKLVIDLGKIYKRGQNYTIAIDYVAKPNEAEVGGSAAITSEKGLFFINPNNEEVGKPMQIWTQGETENNSRWFPTFDKPNERCTQEIYLTVEDKYTTLSNGKLVSSVKNNDGTRTDYWKQDKPHAPYLFMIAVGEYAWVNDTWNGIPLNYIVEKKYEPYAKQIFNHTPEMLQFFSDILDYPYPWDKFAQIITRDYVSGAMENTTAVIFGEFIQKTDRELIDDDNDKIVAHEMFHHWFGDLVTCESWANLTLNEGFANYAEYLWEEHKYGKEAADHHRMMEQDGYLGSAVEGSMHPLIHYHYADKEDMFDAHSYNKGGLVLHYLRNYMGDDAFFAGLHKYLVDNAYSAVEVDELRMAFEDVTGEDLNWFFDQWYLDEGHIHMNVSYDYNVSDQKVYIYTQQLSNKVFKTYFDAVVIDSDGSNTFHRLWTEKVSDTLVINNIETRPVSISLDGKDCVPGIINETKSEEEWAAQFHYGKSLFTRLNGLTHVNENDELMVKMLNSAMDEKYYIYQEYAINLMSNEMANQSAKKLVNIAKGGSHSSVRSSALNRLFSIEDPMANSIAQYQIEHDQSYAVINNALAILSQMDHAMALQSAEKLVSEDGDQLIGGLSTVYASSGDTKYLPWFAKKMKTVSIYQSFDLISQYAMYILNTDIEHIVENLQPLQDIAMSKNENLYKKFMATATIFSLQNQLTELANETNEPHYNIYSKRIEEILTTIKANETNPMLISRYSDF